MAKKELAQKKEKQPLMTDFEISERGKTATRNYVQTSVENAVATAKTGAAGAQAFADYAAEDYGKLVDSGIKTLGTMPNFLSAQVQAGKARMEYSRALAADMKGKSFVNKGIVAKAYAQHMTVTAAEIAASRADGNEEVIKQTISDITNNVTTASRTKAAKSARNANSESKSRSAEDNVVADAEWREVPNSNYESRARQADKMLSNLSLPDNSMSMEMA